MNADLSRPVQSWTHAWRTALKAAGIRYRWHDLRHTFISILAENPMVSEGTIKALAGHVSKKMLERYSHIRANAKREAIAALVSARVGTKLGTISEDETRAGSQVAEKIWLPPRDSNPDMLIQSQLSYH